MFNCVILSYWHLFCDSTVPSRGLQMYYTLISRWRNTFRATKLFAQILTAIKRENWDSNTAWQLPTLDLSMLLGVCEILPSERDGLDGVVARFGKTNNQVSRNEMNDTRKYLNLRGTFLLENIE